jgi:hypothetical protein
MLLTAQEARRDVSPKRAHRSAGERLCQKVPAKKSPEIGEILEIRVDLRQYLDWVVGPAGFEPATTPL